MKLSCLIPCYNEAPRIARVLEVASRHELIDEIVVIDDCSTDETAKIVQGFDKVRLLQNAENLGKTKTIARGLTEVSGDYVLFLDADLLGIDLDDLTRLAKPIRAGKADVSISLRGNAPLPWRMIGIDYISGERILPLALLDGRVDEMNALPKFGLEVFMNGLILQENLRLAIVKWPNVSSPYKAQKRGRWAGMKAEVKMLQDIFNVISPLQAMKQIWQMRARSKAR